MFHEQIFIALHDSETRLLWASHYSPEYDKTKSLTTRGVDLVHPADRKEVANAYGRAAILKEPQYGEWHSPPPKSEPFHSTIYPVEFGPVRFVCVARALPKAIRTLSIRERMICRLYGEGLETSEICKLLKLESSTVETHRANAGRKIGKKGNRFIVWCAEHRPLL